jgi:hypothetical protein
MADFATYGDVGYGGWYNFYQNMNKVIDAVNAKQISPDIFDKVVNPETGQYCKPVYNKAGRVVSVDFMDKPTFSTGNTLNSNAAITRRGTVRTPLVTGNNVGAVTTGRITPPSSMPTRAYVANSIASPLVAVGAGITLGKAIDSTLYNLNPDFWDSNGMSSINPETWNNITMGIDHSDPVTGVAADLMNVIFGLDPDGSVQAYVDEDAFAYMATYMQSEGVFNPPEYEATPPVGIELRTGWVEFPVRVFYGTEVRAHLAGRYGAWWIFATDKPCYWFIWRQPYENNVEVLIACDESFKWGAADNSGGSTWPAPPIPTRQVGVQTLYNKPVAAVHTRSNNSGAHSLDSCTPSWIPSQPEHDGIGNMWEVDMGYVLLYGTENVGGIPGIDDQPGGVTPSGLSPTDVATNLNTLKTQYPDLWDGGFDYPVVQPDGTTIVHHYIPINLPIADGNGDTQPTSGDETQADPKVDPSVSPAELVDLIEKLLQQPEDNPYSNDLPEDVEPPDTGSGETPIAPAPTGEASALWSIYNPTQAQVDAFGAWLWSPSFVDQIAKIFNNPMESIIGLHKVFAAPHTSGSQNIRVGYLDSGVSSAVVDAQYTTVDCGTVNLSEQFASVFDYAPYTEIKLYLPFVGIVELDPAYVMRSTLKVVYHVDVLTGACLAEVRVTRDGESGGTLYQYAGDAAVQYPISSGSYMGIVAGIAGAVGSIAATVATGGGALPMILGAGGSIAGARTHVQNSGGFGGNAGAMGGKRPYLIIGRPQTKVAERFAALQGYPTNYGVRVGDCDGLIRCAEVRGLVADATDSEMDEILEAMKEGVIV